MTLTINSQSFIKQLGKLLFIPAFVVIFSVQSFARTGTAINQLANVLNLYYDVKDALVASDGATASKKATTLLAAIKGIDMSQLTPAESNAFTPLQEKLSFDARHISEVQDVSHQREHFSSLSNNMYTLAKAVKLSTGPVYQDYCPMQKAYWLSKDKEIKNPYYGSQMLTCGKVEKTIN